MKDYNKNGYIALVSMIIIGSVVLFLVLSITFTSLTQKTSMIGQNKSMKGYFLSNACIHYAIVELQKDKNYTGNETVEIDSNSCYIDFIEGQGNEDRVIFASTDIDNYLNKIRVELAQIKPKTIVRSWQELSDF